MRLRPKAPSWEEQDCGIAVEEVVEEGLAVVILPAEFQEKWGEARWWD